MRKEASFISIATAVTLATVGVGGGMYVGALASDVESLQAQEVQRKEDHDTLVALKQDVKNIKEDVDETKNDVKTILTAVQAIQIKIERED